MRPENEPKTNWLVPIFLGLLDRPKKERNKFALVWARPCSTYLDNIEQQISVRATSVQIKTDSQSMHENFTSFMFENARNIFQPW